MRKIDTTDEVIRAVARKMNPKWLRNGGVTDPIRIINEAIARIDATVADMNHRVAQIQFVAMAAAQAMKDDIDWVAEASTHNSMWVPEPKTMRLRPSRAPEHVYRVDWGNVYRVARYVRKKPCTYVLFPDWEVEQPGADCVVSLLRTDCEGVSPSSWPVRVWLWRDLLWEAVHHNSWPTPYEVWCGWRSRQRCI